MVPEQAFPVDIVVIEVHCIFKNTIDEKPLLNFNKQLPNSVAACDWITAFKGVKRKRLM